MQLRARDTNVPEQDSNRQNLKALGTKHKNVLDKNHGEPKAKRAALGDITKALNSYSIDSSKKKTLSTSITVKKAKVERLLPLKDVLDAERLEVDEDPAPDFDFDKENANDPFAVSQYAKDICKYYKWREPMFVPSKYLNVHRNITNKERASLVDWLVELQEAFEMNHETLYMAVNLVDRYLSNVKTIRRDNIQVVACAAAFIAAKVEERQAPLIDDLLYLCRDNFDSKKLQRMEQELLKNIGFDLCSPLSYSFLRRYGRVIKADMSLLTLARYILEVSLHFLDFCRISPSKVAAASLLLALKMSHSGEWNNILHKYSTYKEEDLTELMWSLNHMMIYYRGVLPQCTKVFEKYDHEVFFSVARVKPLRDTYSARDPIGPSPTFMAREEAHMNARRLAME